MDHVGEPNSGFRALLVDDDEAVLRVHAKALAAKGYQIETALNGSVALELLERGGFDIVVTDIDMPGMSGVELLRRVRARDLDVSVVMVTGAPSIDSAAAAVEHGALRYLMKPVELPKLLEIVNDGVRLHRIAKAKRQAIDLAGGVDRFVGDRAGLAANFDRALETLHIAYQPISSWSGRSLFAYEALLRSREPSLPHPGAMLDAAERLGRVHELGRRIRAKAIEPLDQLPAGVALFLNLHPSDLDDDELFSTTGPLAAVASRVVLEMTERASLDGQKDVPGRVKALRDIGFRIALDDLGAGYAGLTSFALLDPEVVKLDMALVRDLHKDPRKQTLVRTMVTMSKELGITVTGEGIETPEERDELARAGCDLMQGYLFAKPAAPFVQPTF